METNWSDLILLLVTLTDLVRHYLVHRRAAPALPPVERQRICTNPHCCGHRVLNDGSPKIMM